MSHLKTVTLSLVLLATAGTAPGGADVLVGDAWTGGIYPRPTPATVHRVSNAGVVTSSAELPLPLGGVFVDYVVSPDGWVYAAAEQGVLARFRPDGSGFEAPWALITPDGRGDRTHDVAFAPDGRLLVASRATGLGGLNALVAVDTTTRAVEVLHVPGTDFEIRGMDVPRAGPLEGGVLLTGADRGAYFLRRLARQADGSLALEGTYGPLDITRDVDCIVGGVLVGRPSLHLSVRPDGRTFLMPDGCTSTVKELDLDGNLVRAVATLTPDPTASWPVPSEYLDNVHVAADGTIWAVMQRRVWHLDPSGGVLQRVDHLFNNAAAACDDRWVPFASDAAGCHGAGLGWWKRQCLSLDRSVARRGGGRPTAGELPAPRALPGIDAVRVLSLLNRVDAQLSALGVTACEALWAEAPRSPRSRALAHLAVLLLNVEDQRLGRRCGVPGTGLDVGGVLERVLALLVLNDAASDAEAAQLAQRAIAAHAADGEDVP